MLRNSDIGTDQYDTSEKQRIPAWTGQLDLFPQYLIVRILIGFANRSYLAEGKEGMWCRQDVYMAT
jgi:hypothetical protein